MKNTLIIAGVCVVVIIAGAWLYFHSQKPSIPAAQNVVGREYRKPVVVGFKVIDHGETAKAISVRKNYAIYGIADFTRFWKDAHGSGTPPIVDFSKNYVVGVFAGTQPSSGYSIAVDRVVDADGIRSITVRITAPDESCVVIEEPTSPYQFVLVPYSDAENLSHTDVVMKKGCPR
jgi:hypothetical protein